MYNFKKNMWIMRKADEGYLKGIVNKKKITQEEFESIIGSEQVTGL